MTGPIDILGPIQRKMSSAIGTVANQSFLVTVLNPAVSVSITLKAMLASQ